MQTRKHSAPISGILVLESVVKRTLSNTFCLLVLTSYLWGGCVFCERFLTVALGTADCCPGSCGRSSHNSSRTRNVPTQPSQVCEQVAWVQTATQDSSEQFAQDYASLPVSTLTVSTLLDVNEMRGHLHRVPDPGRASPADLPILHASLLI